jgi:pimeloyl-ACP methyl ester carboxylesterase
MSVFVVAHGAWSAGWAWKRMRPLLRARGHELFTPTYTGLGERIHLASRDVGLDTHINDVLGVLDCEDLHDVLLVGHSYGGMVATAVADRASRRISQLVYLDAFVPRDGESLFDLQPPEVRARVRDAVRTEGEGWRVPPNPLPPDMGAADRAWIQPRRFMHPLKAFEQPVRLSGAVDTLPRTYIYCTRPGAGDPFRRFAGRARTEAGWRCLEIDSSHNPHITVPETLAAMLDDIACVSTGARP